MSNRPPTLFPELDVPETHYRGGGVLPLQMIEEAIRSGHISAVPAISPSQIQPASLDLRLDKVAYRVRASFLPSKRHTVLNRLDDLKLYELDLSSPAVLERGCVYIVPLMEQLNLPVHLSAKANPKSSTGRLDVFARLITDYGSQFERVPAGYKGRLYIEVVPRTFSIRVRQGTTLNQLRLIRGNPISSDATLAALHETETLVYEPDRSPAEARISKGLTVSISLEPEQASELIGYRAKKDAPLIDLDMRDHYDPKDFWEPLFPSKSRALVLSPEEFYVLGSRERISIPPEFAAEMVPYDPALGEFRIHYAGFLDPGFGYDDNVRGTAAVLQVRSHEVPFVFEHGQLVGTLVFERLLAKPDRLYGAQSGSSYQHQRLSLSKQFKREWPGVIPPERPER
jgi:dCTP deaminase